MALNSEPVAYMSGDMAGIAMQCVNVTIVDEDIVEPDETFNVLLSSDDPGVQISAMSDQAMATITNDDRKFHCSLYCTDRLTMLRETYHVVRIIL